jgi:peptidoglycan/LPS O-acetylase OafA/YrhL
VAVEIQNRQVGIDFARSIAIISVVLVHTTGIGFGRFGVQLFFLISGYLLGNYKSHFSPGKFILHRAVRLFPLYLFFFAIYQLNQSDHFHLLNLLLLGNLDGRTSQVPGGWSISNEWMFSIFLALLGLHTKRKLFFLIYLSMLAQLCSGLWVFMQGGVNGDSDQYAILTWLNTTNPLINLSFFLIGVAIRAQLLPNSIPKMMSYFMIVFCIVIDIMVGHILFLWNFGLYGVFSLCYQCNYSAKIAHIVHYIGKRTYGIFFSHFFLIELFNSGLSGISFPSNGLRESFLFFSVLCASVFLGACSWKFLESPSLRKYQSSGNFNALRRKL